MCLHLNCHVLPDYVYKHGLKSIRDFVICMPVVENSDNRVAVLGSDYGKKAIELPEFQQHIISAGVGLDFSWEQEMLRINGSKICLIYPTSRSKEIVTSYLDSKEYLEVSKLFSGNIVFLNMALFNHNGTITIYPPKNPLHNDYSIMNLQKVSKDSAIVCPSITINQVSKLMGWDRIDILKLDIEGSVLEVLNDTFSNLIFPIQIAIEIDELFFHL